MLTRRTTLACVGMFPFVAVSAENSDAAPRPAFADAEAADRWMRNWMRAELKVRGTEGMLYVGRFADPYYFTLDEIGWAPEGDQIGRYQRVRVPIGFVTDFASIPRIFWSALRPDGEYSYAAVIHDYLYWEQPCDRLSADEIFKICMEEFKIGSTTIAAIYAGVRLGGESAWQENLKLKASGKRRVLTRTPKDPKIKWEQWQTMTDVF